MFLMLLIFYPLIYEHKCVLETILVLKGWLYNNAIPVPKRLVKTSKIDSLSNMAV